MYMAHRINMKDIAREAGVSVATVSYIINKRSDQSIAPDTVARVNEAIKKLGYVPNLGARALANRKTRLIGLVIPQAETGSRMMLENSFYGEFIAVLEEVLRQSGYSLLLSGEDVNKSYVELARERALDGIVVVGLPADQDARLLLEENIPLVFVDSYLEGNAYSSVNIQDEEGGYLACDYLIKNGHRNIAFVSGFLSQEGVNRKRFRGYGKALLENGIEEKKEYVLSGRISYSYGIEAGRQIAAMKERPSAVFATADILALGIMRGLKSEGLSVPRDVSVIGFDDGFLALSAEPSLTSIHQDAGQKARVTARLLFAQMDKGAACIENLVLPLALTVRDSVRRI